MSLTFEATLTCGWCHKVKKVVTVEIVMDARKIPVLKIEGADDWDLEAEDFYHDPTHFCPGCKKERRGY